MIPPPKVCWRRSFVLPAGGFGGGGHCKLHSGSKKEPWRGPGSGAAHGTSKNPVVSNSKIGIDHGNVNWNRPNKDLMLFLNTSAACIINRT